MSDFLTNLAVRSAESPAQVLPRPQSLFGPEAAAPEPETFDERLPWPDGEAEPTAVASMAQSPAASRGAEPIDDSAGPRVEPLARPRQPASSAETTWEHAIPDPIARLAPRIFPQQATRSVERTIAPQPELAQAIDPLVIAGSPASAAGSPGVARRHDRLTPAEQAEQYGDHNPRRHGEVERRTAERDAEALGRSENSHTMALAPARGRAGAEPTVLPQVQPYLPPAPAASTTQPAAAPPAPVVQVTIGRVEVRATTPPARRERSEARHSAVQTLDEYLRRRGGR